MVNSSHSAHHISALTSDLHLLPVASFTHRKHISMAAKKQIVKLQVPLAFLASLPAFATPKPKSRVKKLTVDEKKSATSPGSSPAPAEDSQTQKINTGPKELSTAGLSVNTSSQTLDKSGSACRKWTRGLKQFKTFSGFKIKIRRYVAKDVKAEPKAVPVETAVEPVVAV